MKSDMKSMKPADMKKMKKSKSMNIRPKNMPMGDDEMKKILRATKPNRGASGSGRY